MTNTEVKQEAVKKAYGEGNYNLFKDEINEDGFIYNRSQFDEYDENDIEYHKMKSFFDENDNVEEVRNMWRPKSLQGLEDNNGWIRLESEDDLPKNGITYYRYCCNGKPSIHIVELPYLLSIYKDGYVSHYQPIEKTNPPIY